MLGDGIPGLGLKLVRHTLRFTDGRVYDVYKIIKLVRGRKVVRTYLSRLVFKCTRRSGFRRYRYILADVRFPLIVGPGNHVYDGRHRATKLKNMGRKTVRIIRVTEQDIEKALIKGSSK